MSRLLLLLLVVTSLSAATVPLPPPSEWVTGGLPTAPGESFPLTCTGATVANAPAISEWQRTARPDETFTMTGIRFTARSGAAAGSDTTVWLAARTAAGAVVLRQCQLWKIQGDLLNATVPADLPLGLYVVWVENEHGASTPVCLNRTDGRWIGPLGAQVPVNTAGTTKRIFGRNLTTALGTTASHVYLRRSGSSTLEALTTTALKSQYEVEVALPSNLPAGTHHLFIHNGHGGNLGWSGPHTITAAAPFVRDTFTVNLTAPTSGNANSIVTTAISTVAGRANGGTVSFGAGTFKLTTQINVGSKVRLKGAGRSATVLLMEPPTGPSWPAHGIWMTGSNIAVEDMEVRWSGAGNRYHYGPFDCEANDLLIRNCALTYAANNNVNEMYGCFARLNGSRIRIVDSLLVNSVWLMGSDNWVHGTTLHGGPYGGTWLDALPWEQKKAGESEGALYPGGSRLVIEDNLVETPNWPNVGGNRQYLELIPAAQLQWRPWAKRFFVTGGGNQQWHVARNLGKDLGFDGNKGEIMLFHGSTHVFYAQLAAATATTATIRTDGTIFGNAGVRVDTYGSHNVNDGSGWPAAKSFNAYINPWSTTATDDIDGEHVMIVRGPGLGQVRRIVSHTATTITLDRPWRVQPTADSVLAVESINRDIVIHDNEMNGFPSGYDLFYSASSLVSWDGQSIDCVTEANTVRRTFYMMHISGGHTYPAWWHIMRGNRGEDIYNSGYGPKNWSSGSGNYELGTPVLAASHYDNTLTISSQQQETHLGNGFLIASYGSNNTMRGIVYERNVGSGSEIGMNFGSAANALLRDNSVTVRDNARTPYTWRSPPHDLRTAANVTANMGTSMLGTTYAGGGTKYKGTTKALLLPATRVAHWKLGAGQTPGNATVVITNAGTQALTWSVASTSHAWITATAGGTAIAAEASTGTLTIAINCTSLANGVHWGQVNLTTTSGETAVVGVRVELTGDAPVTNTAPTISAIADRSVVAGVSTGAIAFTVGDAETAAGSLMVTRTSSNTALIPVANVVLGGSGASRTVTVTSAGTATGTSTITLTVSDGTLTTNRAFTVTVTAPPTDTTPPATPAAPTVSGDGTARPTFSGISEPGATITISAGGTVLGTTTANGSGAWTWTPTTDLPAGTHQITITATDSAGNTSTASPATTITVPIASDGGGDSGASGSNGGRCGLGSGMAAGLALLCLLMNGLGRQSTR